MELAHTIWVVIFREFGMSSSLNTVRMYVILILWIKPTKIEPYENYHFSF